MLKNYIKIAFKVMLRQKFFTAVSIFGISFTIMIISFTTGMINMNLGDVAPAVSRSKTLYYEGFTSRLNDKTISPEPSPNFLNDVKKINGVERLSMFVTGRVASINNEEKVSISVVFADEELWGIYDHQFLEGRPYTRKESIEGQSVAVITESVKRFYFGDEPAVGKTLPTTPAFKVIGVVKDFVQGFSAVESSGIYVPLMRYHPSTAEFARYQGIIQARTKQDVQPVKAQMLKLIQKKYSPPGATAYLNAKDIYDGMDFESMIVIVTCFIFFMMAVPAINMIGLNINRIAERSSEIGIRKAFGASSAVLTRQFITENLIVTFLGASIGVLLTFAASKPFISLLYSSDDIAPSGYFLVNWTVIIYSIGAALFFGLLSGVIPAWRMSRLHAVKALKGENL